MIALAFGLLSLGAVCAGIWWLWKRAVRGFMGW